jgi:hypothetical protein
MRGGSDAAGGAAGGGASATLGDVASGRVATSAGDRPCHQYHPPAAAISTSTATVTSTAFFIAAPSADIESRERSSFMVPQAVSAPP